MQDMFTIVGYGAAASRNQRQNMLSSLLDITEECGHKCHKFLLNGRSARYKSIADADLTNENIEAMRRDESKKFMMMGYTAAIDISPYHYCLSVDSQSVQHEHLFAKCVSYEWACYCIGATIPLECAPTLYGRAVAFSTDEWVGREYREYPKETNAWSVIMKSAGFCSDSSVRNVYEYNYCTGGRLRHLTATLSETSVATRTVCFGGEIIAVPCVEDRLKSRRIILSS